MHLVRDRAHQFGVRGIDPQALSFDLAAAVGRKDEIVGGIISGIKSGLAKSEAITFINGRAAFTSPNRKERIYTLQPQNSFYNHLPNPFAGHAQPWDCAEVLITIGVTYETGSSH